MVEVDFVEELTPQLVDCFEYEVSCNEVLELSVIYNYLQQKMMKCL